MALSGKQISMIHTARLKVGMTDAEYRDMLAGFSVDSCKRLTQRQFDAVVDHFERLGFKPRKKKRRKVRPAEDRAAMLRKITAICADLGYPDDYADGIAKKMFGIDRAEWCKPNQLHKLVAALAIHQGRKGRGR